MSDEPCLIWSIEHTAWWAPNSWGYVQTALEAGRFSRAEAERIVADANIVAVHECLIPPSAVCAPELLAALQMARTVIAMACGERAPFARIALAEIDAAIAQTLGSPPSTNAVDPHAQRPGNPSPRAKQSAIEISSVEQTIEDAERSDR